MLDRVAVVRCRDCGVHWYGDSEPATCTSETHRHDRFEIHRHRTVVVLPDTTEVVAVSFDAAAPYARDQPPAYGLYLDSRWQPPWPHDHIDWPDFAVPADVAALRSSLQVLLDQARLGRRVEIGCVGGHGRTGTA